MDDKKKILVMGALFAVVIGVGAFQLTSGGLSGPQEKPKGASTQTATAEGEAKDGKKATETEFEIRNPLVAKALPVRDPFQEGKVTTSVKPPSTTPQNRTPNRRSNGNSSIPPFNPNIGGTLPGAYPGGTGTSLQPGVPLRDPNAFTMSVTGVIMGTRPAAIFQDDAGNQRLVALGGELDGGSRVTGISRGKVTVSHKGKTVTLTVGANTDGN